MNGKHTQEAREKMRLAGIGRLHTQESKDKIRLAHLGEKNPNWKGGRCFAYYNRIAKENLIQKCVLCLKTQQLEIHHKDLDRKNNQLSNIVILCKSCHTKIHKKEKNFSKLGEL